jgi:CxxC-x17-CxxC domain-containing protein
MAYQDLTLQCADCGSNFEFTAGEQEFYASKGLVNTPKRCPNCRNSRKRMNSRGGRPRQMYDAVCSECGVETQVPFKPSEDKPVYCKTCFENSKSAI